MEKSSAEDSSELSLQKDQPRVEGGENPLLKFILWTLATAVLTVGCWAIVKSGPDGIAGTAARVQIGTDGRLDRQEFAGKDVKGLAALYENTTPATALRVCPEMKSVPNDELPVDSGLIRFKVLKISIDGVGKCLVQGRKSEFEGLDLKFIEFSGRSCHVPPTKGGEELCADIAEVSIQRANGEWLNICSLLFTAFLGAAAAQMVNFGVRSWRRRAAERP